MGQREQGRRSFGKARRCTAGFVLVSMLQLLASAGSQHVSGAQAAVDRQDGRSGAVANDILARGEGRPGLLRQGGLRSLQEEEEEEGEETPSPVESETEQETPAPEEPEETPPPEEEEPAPETPAPVDEADEGEQTPETPGPVDNVTPETPVPVDNVTPAPEEDEAASETPAPVAEGEDTFETPAPVAEGEDTPETPGPVGEDGSPAPVESGEEGTAETPAPVGDGTTPTPVAPEPAGTAAPFAPSTCSGGIPGVQDGSVCCLEACGRCGGDGCGTIPGTGGSANCCPSDILAAGTVCGEAPCIIEGFTPAPAVVGGGSAAPIGTSTCSNGILGFQDGPVCCAANCGQCGGPGCGAVPGTAGSSACCSTIIEVEGDLCSVTGDAPCIIDNYTPAPVVPDFGTTAPFVPSTCINGLAGTQNNDICCIESCGVCGGAGCGTIPGTGGSAFCCPSTIREAGVMCDQGVEAPCIIGGFTPSPVNPALEGTAAPVVPTTCTNGLPGFQNGAACCLESCGQCGGVGCGTVPGTGGSEFCCATDVLEANVICGNGNVAPCVIENFTPAPMGVPGEVQPFASSMCTNGLSGVQDGNICCAENCGQCGGVGCGTVPGTGGSDSCCSSTIAVNGTDCLDSMAAPCIISDFVETPSPTVFVSAAPVVPGTCSNGMPGFQDDQVCCQLNCGQCGGVGCGTIVGTAGSSDCCPSEILLSNQTCGGDVVPPCILPMTPAPTLAPAATPFPTRTPFVAGNANDFINDTSSAEPGVLQTPAGMLMPLATAAAAFLGALAISAQHARGGDAAAAAAAAVARS